MRQTIVRDQMATHAFSQIDDLFIYFAIAAAKPIAPVCSAVVCRPFVTWLISGLKRAGSSLAMGQALPKTVQRKSASSI